MSRSRSDGRHSLQVPSPRRPRLTRLGLVAGVVTTAVVALGVVLGGVSGALVSGGGADLSGARAQAATATQPTRDPQERTVRVSRSAERTALPRPAAVGKLWTTAPLDERLQPKQHARTAGVLPDGKHVSVTGRRSHGYAEVIVGVSTRWVTAEYLSKKKEVLPGSKGLVDKPCAGTSGVESGLTSGAVRVYRAVCNNFPQITQYGGYAARGEHSSGKAIDIMNSDTGLGDQIAAFLQRNAAALDLYDIIWQQHIWTPVRSSEGWRSMSDRGSETANHFDHVHVSVN